MSKEKEEEKIKAEEQAKKRANFKETATRRVQKAVQLIESLQQVTSNNYAYTKQDVEVIKKNLQESLDKTCEVLLNPKAKNQIKLFED